jgi:hypothetical protein
MERRSLAIILPLDGCLLAGLKSRRGSRACDLDDALTSVPSFPEFLGTHTKTLAKVGEAARARRAKDLKNILWGAKESGE